MLDYLQLISEFAYQHFNHPNMKPTDKRVDIYGLFFGCPEIHPLQDCPFAPLRKHSAIEKINILEKLADENVDELLLDHHNCLSNRINQNIRIFSGSV